MSARPQRGARHRGGAGGRGTVYAVVATSIALSLAGCASSDAHPTTTPSRQPTKGKVEEGLASWYGPGFHGRHTASGEVFDMHALTAAHRTLPLGTLIEVRNLENGRTLVARVNDRGPWVRSRIVDLSLAAAQELGLEQRGIGRVRLTVVGRPLDSPSAYWVQVGAFRDEGNARALAADLEQRYPGTAVRAKEEWYQVQVPSGEKRRAAEALRRELRREGFEALLVTAVGRPPG